MPSSIPLPQVNLGKRKDKTQMCHVSTTDGRLVAEEIPVVANCAMSDKFTALFLMDDTEQYLGPDGHFYQLYSDKSQIPLMPKSEAGKKALSEKNMAVSANDIFDLTEEMKTYENIMSAKKNSFGETLKWIVSVVFGAFVIIAALYFFFGG
jgi:hypothetical protein